MEYVKRNVNPKGKSTSDCVVRAIAIATGKSWEEVYNVLCETGRRMCMMPNSKGVYADYLESIGWLKNKMPRHASGTRFKVSELADTYRRATMIVEVCGHLTVISDCMLTDTWNCGKKCVYNYYTKS